MTRHLLATTFAAVLLAGCQPEPAPSPPPPQPEAPPTVQITHAYANQPPAGATVAAAYLDITASHGDTLLAAASPAAGEVQIHTSEAVDGVMRMRPLADVELPAGETVRFEPGGKHFMLMNLPAPLEAGDELSLTLQLASAGALEVTVPVVAMGESPGDDLDDHGHHAHDH